MLLEAKYNYLLYRTLVTNDYFLGTNKSLLTAFGAKQTLVSISSHSAHNERYFLYLFNSVCFLTDNTV